jgi:hypothetical protein
MAKEPPWWSDTDPTAMLRHIGASLGPRKQRLFACACCRVTGLLAHAPACLQALEVAERFADGAATEAELAAARAAPGRGWSEAVWGWLVAAVESACYPPHRSLAYLLDASDCAARAARDAAGQTDWSAARRLQADLLRDLVGRKARPVWPAWLNWGGGAVRQLARAIYQDHAFGELAVLADALEEAGCDDAELLGHCRAPGRHARGCWLLDALLGNQ